ncbi:MAG: CRP-like cAMP-binding protein [Oceanicoccus sp.]|jgi:CRP-like cAMP-binding protein
MMNFFELIEREGKPVEKPKYGLVFRQGELDQSLYLLRSGLLKAFYTSPDGKEFIKSFIVPNDIIGSLVSARNGSGCSFSLICLEPSTLIRIPFSTIVTYSKTEPEIADAMMDVLLNFAMKKERREFEFLCLSAEQRFELLVEKDPVILEKVTQNDIAHYLGITPVALSRIRKRVREK